MDKAAAVGISNGADWNAKLAKDRQTAAVAEAARYEATRNPATKMSVENMTWSFGGFGTVAVVTLTINNSNDFPVKDVGLECRFQRVRVVPNFPPRHTRFSIPSKQRASVPLRKSMWGSLTANRRERAAESRRRSGRNALRLVHTPNPIHWARPSICVSSARVNVTEGMAMLDSEFKKQRAQLARELAEVAKDRFIKQRLLDLAARYEDNRPPTAITPVDLGIRNHRIGSER